MNAGPAAEPGTPTRPSAAAEDPAPSPEPSWWRPAVGPIVPTALVIALLWGGASVWTVGVSATLAAAAMVAWGGYRERSWADHTRDVSRQAQRESRQWQSRWQRLHAETRQNASVLLQMTDGVVVLAPDRSILLINPSARRLLGITGKERLLGRPFPEVVRIPEVVTAVRETLARNRPQALTVEVSDGEIVRPLKLLVDRIETAAESNLLLTIHDETETRRVEEIRREFVANVSHEFKTPLAAIKGYAETVETALEDDPQAAAHFMKQIHQQCLRLERLVSEMMLLARAQAGRANLKTAELVLGPIIAESIKSYRPVAERKQISLDVADGADQAIVVADREATLTIVNNLIGNAIRYTPDGGHVRVGLRAEPGPPASGQGPPASGSGLPASGQGPTASGQGAPESPPPPGPADYWAVVVRDDGIGIPAGEQERIFERFYRVEKARETATGGTGLGLSIVKNLTLAQGGRVKVVSSPGQGSTFEVWLPTPLGGRLPQGDHD